MSLFFASISGDPQGAFRLRRRSRQLLLACLAASVALHATLLVVFPGYVEREMPPEARVLDVVLVDAQAPEPIKQAPPEPPAPVKPAPRKRFEKGEARKTAPSAPELSRKPEKERFPARPEDPALAQRAPEPASEAMREPGSAPEQGSEATRAQEGRGIVTPPTFNAAYLRNPPPRYPLAARRNGEQGTVTLRVFVTRDGLPASVNIERTSGSKHLDNAAVETVRSWRFVPARRGDTPVEAWVLVPIVFRLEGTS